MTVYSNPEDYDLKIVYEINVAGSYEFDVLVIWQKPDQSFVYGIDNGCSCPGWFENISAKHLKPAVPEAIREWFIEKLDHPGYKVGELEKALSVIQPFSKDDLKRADSWKTTEELGKFVDDRMREDE